MKLKIALVITIIVIILQPFLLSLLPEALAPNLGFCFLVICAATMKESDAVIPMIVIIIESFFIDFFSNQYVGAAAIAMILPLIGIILVRKHMDLENPIHIAGLVLATNIVYGIVYWMVYRIIGTTYGFLYILKSLPSGIVVNSLTMFIGVFLAARKASRLRRDSYFDNMK